MCKRCSHRCTPISNESELEVMELVFPTGFQDAYLHEYKVFWTKIEPLIINCYTESFEVGCMSTLQRRGVLTLLHKGKDLPRDNISNWRPISLTNTDYKILSKVLASRLQKVVGHIVSEDQCGYIKGRHSGMVIRAIDDVIEYVNERNMPGAILSLDYTKAFDSLSKEFMYKSLEVFGLGNKFVRWIKVINHGTVSCVSYNGWLSNWFSLNCGIRQGCPISPLCFIIACEILSCKIRQDDKVRGINLPNSASIKILAYADDATLFVEDEKSIHESFVLIDVFSRISNLQLNRNKTYAIWVGW